MKSEQNVTPQLALFFDDIYQALMTDVMALGGTKEVGHMLWGESLKVNKASEKLSDCLNTARQQKLSLDEMLVIQREARKVGSYATAYFIAGETGFTQPQPIEPEDEKAMLQTQAIQAVKSLDQIVSRLEKIT